MIRQNSINKEAAIDEYYALSFDENCRYVGGAVVDAHFHARPAHRVLRVQPAQPRPPNLTAHAAFPATPSIQKVSINHNPHLSIK